VPRKSGEIPGNVGPAIFSYTHVSLADYHMQISVEGFRNNNGIFWDLVFMILGHIVTGPVTRGGNDCELCNTGVG
jgi:hypothetical protein